MERRLPRKREILLLLGDSSPTSTLREDLRVSLFQKLGDVEGEVELGEVIAEVCEDNKECWCTESSSQRFIGIGSEGRGKDRASGLNGGVIVLVFMAVCCGRSVLLSLDRWVSCLSWLRSEAMLRALAFCTIRPLREGGWELIVVELKSHESVVCGVFGLSGRWRRS